MSSPRATMADPFPLRRQSRLPILTTSALAPASAKTAARLATTAERVGSTPGDTTRTTCLVGPHPLCPLPGSSCPASSGRPGCAGYPGATPRSDGHGAPYRSPVAVPVAVAVSVPVAVAVSVPVAVGQRHQLGRERLEENGGMQSAVCLGHVRHGVVDDLQAGVGRPALQRLQPGAVGRDLGHDGEIEGLLGGAHGPQAPIERLHRHDDPERDEHAHDQAPEYPRRLVVDDRSNGGLAPTAAAHGPGGLEHFVPRSLGTGDRQLHLLLHRRGEPALKHAFLDLEECRAARGCARARQLGVGFRELALEVGDRLVDDGGSGRVVSRAWC